MAFDQKKGRKVRVVAREKGGSNLAIEPSGAGEGKQQKRKATMEKATKKIWEREKTSRPSYPEEKDCRGIFKGGGGNLHKKKTEGP